MNPINSELAGIVILASLCFIGWGLAQCVILALRFHEWRQHKGGNHDKAR